MILLIDVDGVINLPFIEALGELKSIELNLSKTLVVDPFVISELNRLDDFGVRIIWCTSWFEKASHVLSPAVGLHENWEHLGNSASTPFAKQQDFSWKLELVKEFRSKHPTEIIVWADDDLVHDNQRPTWMISGGEEALHWAHENSVITLSPHMDEGLTRAMIARIWELAIAESLSAQAKE